MSMNGERRMRNRAETTDVGRPLDELGRPLERDLVDGDDREPVEVLDVGLEGQELEEVGDEPDVDRILVDDPEGLDDLGVVVEVQGHVDLGDAVFLDDGPEIVEPAQDLDARR